MVVYGKAMLNPLLVPFFPFGRLLKRFSCFSLFVLFFCLCALFPWFDCHSISFSQAVIICHCPVFWVFSATESLSQQRNKLGKLSQADDRFLETKKGIQE